MARVAALTMHAPDTPARLSPLAKRVASTLVLAPGLVWVTVAAPPWAFAALVTVASALACAELGTLLSRAAQPVHGRLMVAVGAALTASFALGPAAPAGSALLDRLPGPGLVLTLGAGVILAAALVGRESPDVRRTASTLLGVVYIGWLLGHVIWLHARPAGPGLVLLLLGATWAGESAAYLVGSRIGRHRLAPVLSPRKTVEGGAAQVLVSTGTAALLGAWLLPACGAAGAAGAGLVLGLVGQVGDLAESAVKRSVGAKDAGDLIPGHGGMLDRIDSLLFNAPALSIYAGYVWCTA